MQLNRTREDVYEAEQQQSLYKSNTFLLLWISAHSRNKFTCVQIDFSFIRFFAINKFTHTRTTRIFQIQNEHQLFLFIYVKKYDMDKIALPQTNENIKYSDLMRHWAPLSYLPILFYTSCFNSILFYQKMKLFKYFN